MTTGHLRKGQCRARRLSGSMPAAASTKATWPLMPWARKGLGACPRSVRVRLPVDHDVVVAGLALPGGAGVGGAVGEKGGVDVGDGEVVAAPEHPRAIALGDHRPVPGCSDHALGTRPGRTYIPSARHRWVDLQGSHARRRAGTEAISPGPGSRPQNCGCLQTGNEVGHGPEGIERSPTVRCPTARRPPAHRGPARKVNSWTTPRRRSPAKPGSTTSWCRRST